MKKTILIPILVLFSMVAFAQDPTPRANARQLAQHERIAQGRQSGEINKGETRVLRGEQRNIRRSERRAKADGDVTVREKRRLERKQDRASRHIHRAKNN